MTRVAFWYDRPLEYTGGLNYFYNLLYAISTVNDRTIEPFVFFGTRVPEASIARFRGVAEVVRSDVLDRGSVRWFMQRSLARLLGSHIVALRELRRWGIDVLSHAEHLYGPGFPVRVISWLPDFQYLHLPELFPGLDVAAESARMRRMVEDADAIVLSSHAALADLRTICSPRAAARATVLQFVAQPTGSDREDQELQSIEVVRGKYGIQGAYFFLPNQFWVHKNHRVVFEAVALLKQAGLDVQVVCTGNLRDYRYRNSDHVESLMAIIGEHGLERHLRVLGLIDYADVVTLMRGSLAVLNPSIFEGWSSTVEEARSLGLRLILSGIAVHREQDPPGARYFPPDDPAALAEILRDCWLECPDGLARPVMSLQEARAALRERTAAFGRAYLDLARQVVAAPRGR